MNGHRDEQFTKRVEFTAKDATEQVATGIVMVPDKVDLQGDFARPDTIAEFAEQFGDFYEVERADGGVMHAVWPSDHIGLERNEVTAGETQIGGQAVPAGAWVQSWKFNDAELWGLVEDGILGGYSIGAVDVEWSNPMPQDDLPDEVSVAEDYPEDEPVYELKDGLVKEVSAVDIPAVPDALILETKADEATAMKRLADHLGNRDGFIEEAIERGHEEASAERLWTYLNRAVDEDGAGEPGKESIFARVGKAALGVLSGDDSGDSRLKESRTLSKANRQRAMAAHDAMEDLLQSEIDFEANRFTDDEDIDFDIAEFGKAAETADSDPELNPDGGGDTQTADTMENENDPLADAPEWARSLHDTVEQNSERIDEAVESAAEPEPDEGAKEAEADEADAFDDAPEWAKALKNDIEQNSQRIDDVATASGASQQLDESSTETFGKYDDNWSKTLGLPTAEGGAD